MAILALTAAQMMSKSTTLYFKPDMALGLVWLTWYLYATSGTRAKKAVASSRCGLIAHKEGAAPAKNGLLS
jgi:hypothetical protein